MNQLSELFYAVLCKSCAPWYANMSLAFYVFFCFSLDYFVPPMVASVVLDLVSSVLCQDCQETGWEEHLWIDLFCMECDTKLNQSINLSQLFGVFCFKLLHVLQTFCQLLAMRRIPQLLFSLLYQPLSQQLRIQLVRILQADMILTRWITPVLWDLAHRQQPQRILPHDLWKLCTATKTKSRWQYHNRLQMSTWCKTNLVERRQLHGT